MNFKLDAFFKSPYLFEVSIYFRHMHLWRDPHMRKSPWSPTPSVFLRHPVKPLKKNQTFESDLSSFPVFFLQHEKCPHIKTLVSHQPISLCRNNGRKSRSDLYLQKTLS